MKQITQPSEITFSAISFQEAIIMVSLMNDLAVRFNSAKEEIDEIINHPDLYSKEDINAIRKEYVKFGQQLQILQKLGFCASDPTLIQFEEDFPKLK